MNQNRAILLRSTAIEVAKSFSDPNRAFNFNNETFTVNCITPLSDDTAIVNLKKNTGKEVLFFFYWVNIGNGKWWYFAPSDSHIIGMEQFGKYKLQLEEKNFQYNFQNEL